MKNSEITDSSNVLIWPNPIHLTLSTSFSSKTCLEFVKRHRKRLQKTKKFLEKKLSMVTKNFLTPSLLILLKSDLVSWLWSSVMVFQVSSFSVLLYYNYILSSRAIQISKSTTLFSWLIFTPRYFKCKLRTKLVNVTYPFL